MPWYLYRYGRVHVLEKWFFFNFSLNTSAFGGLVGLLLFWVIL